MELPRALAPWSTYLNLFSDDLGAFVGTVVERLDRIFGSFNWQHADEQGDPEGYDGIDRRGVYERLMLSEWLLAEEIPEEFLRRAACAEHTFLQLARAAPAERRQIVALFDAGPAQLGAPRLVHLAILILLARRADTGAAKLSWGVLQNPCEVYHGLNSHSILHLLKGRTLQEVTEDNLQDWSGFLNDMPADLWTVGHRNYGFSLQHYSSVRVKELCDPDQRMLQVEVERRNSPSRKILLPFPDQVQGARLLRNPFNKTADAVAPVESCPMRSNIFFSASGKNFIMRGNGDSICIFRTPPNPTDEVIRPKIYRSRLRRPIVAAGAGILKAAAVLVTLSEDCEQLQIEFIGGLFHDRIITATLPDLNFYHILESLEDENYLAQVIGCGRNQDQLFLAFKDVPYYIKLGHCEVEAKPCCEAYFYLTATGHHNSLVFVGHNGSVTAHNEERVERRQILATADGLTKVHIGAGGRASIPGIGILAFGYDQNQWTVQDRQGELIFCKLPAVDVLGVVGLWEQERAGLVVVDHARPCNPYIMGHDYKFDLPATLAPVNQLAVNVYGNMVYTSTAAELIIYEPGRPVLYHLLPSPDHETDF